MPGQNGAFSSICRNRFGHLRSAGFGASAVAASLLVGGCDRLASVDLRTDRAAPGPALVTASPPLPQDPLLAFAATAAPGSRGVVDGQPVRIARIYAAASGRECREILVGGGLGERSVIACHDEVAGWSLARPLLRGSGLGRP